MPAEPPADRPRHRRVPDSCRPAWLRCARARRAASLLRPARGGSARLRIQLLDDTQRRRLTGQRQRVEGLRADVFVEAHVDDRPFGAKDGSTTGSGSEIEGAVGMMTPSSRMSARALCNRLLTVETGRSRNPATSRWLHASDVVKRRNVAKGRRQTPHGADSPQSALAFHRLVGGRCTGGARSGLSPSTGMSRRRRIRMHWLRTMPKNQGANFAVSRKAPSD